jgi:GAF domain-containing protein
VAARLAWGLAAVTLLFVIADGVIIGQYLSPMSESAVAMQGFPFIPGAVLGSSVMGALIITRDARHVVGWLLNVIGTLGALSIVLEAYAIWVGQHDGPGSTVLAGYAGWLSTLVGGQIALMGLALLFLLVPDGHLLSARWRYAMAVPGLGGVLCLLAVATADPRAYELTGEVGLAETGNGVVFAAGLVLIIAGLLMSLVGLLIRLARSQGEQRRQLRLITLSAGCVCLGLTWSVVGEARNGGSQTWATSLPLFTAYLLMPVLFAIAVLRYRLYDVEVIISRTLMVAAGTAFAGAGYTALVVGAGEIADRVSDQLWFPLAATMLVALAFQPARRTVLRLSQRLAFGSRAQPYEALADFSARLAQLPSPESLLATVSEAAGQAVGARRVTVELHTAIPDAVSAEWGAPPSPGEQEHEVHVHARGVVIGGIAVTMPKGSPLRTSDRRLLEALAEQAGIAFRNAAMQAELTRHVAELARTTEALDRSRARIIEADDTVRRDLSSAISRQVLPHLQAVENQLGHGSVPDTSEATVPALEAMALRVNAALEALRELTRGVHATQLSRMGLEPAIRALLFRSGGGAALHVAPSAAERRFSPRIEAAVYFCCAQAVTPHADIKWVGLGVDSDVLVHTVAGVRPPGMDLIAVQDRAGAAGGRVEIDDQVLTLRFPVEAPGSVAAQLVTSRQI